MLNRFRARFFLIILAGVMILVFFLFQESKTPANFCVSLDAADILLEDKNGDTYSLSFFDHRSSDPGDFADALKELERASPDEIQSDVKTLRQIFEKIDEDPSQALSASLAGIGPENSVKQYIDQNCEI